MYGKVWRSPSTVRRDKRRLTQWLARKSGEAMECNPVTNLDTVKPEVARESLVSSTHKSDVDNLDIDTASEISDTLPSCGWDFFDSIPDNVPRNKIPTADFSNSDSDSDLDLFVDFLHPRPQVCFCNRSSDQLKICSKCYSTALCDRLQCKREHAKLCNSLT